MSVLVQTSTTETAPGISPLFADSAARIRQLLRSERGERLIKRIFWEVLDYEQADDPIPFSILPEHLRDQIAHAHIIAQLGATKVCLIRLLASDLSTATQLPILEALEREWPGGIIIFAGLTQNHFELHLLNDDGLRRRIDLRHDEDLSDHTLQTLVQLCAFSPEALAPLSDLELNDKLQRMARTLPVQRRGTRKADTPFWREVGHHKLLTPTEEKHLRRSLTPGKRSPARDRLILANLRLVVMIASQYRHRGVEFEDLIQAGCVGLMRGADLYNPDLGFRFSTYAYYWIFQAVTRTVYQNSPMGVPVYMVDLIMRYRFEYRSFIAEHHRPPSDREMAKTLRLSADRYHRLRQAMIASGWRKPDLDALPEVRSPLPPEIRVLHREIHERMDDAATINAGRARQIDIIRQRHGLDGGGERTLEQIGVQYRMTRERIRQIQKNAEGWLRDHCLKGFADDPPKVAQASSPTVPRPSRPAGKHPREEKHPCT